MPKMKIHTIMLGPDHRANPGDIIDVTDEVAEQLVAGGYGSPVGADGEIEEATAAPTERAVTRKKKGT